MAGGLGEWTLRGARSRILRTNKPTAGAMLLQFSKSNECLLSSALRGNAVKMPSKCRQCRQCRQNAINASLSSSTYELSVKQKKKVQPRVLIQKKKVQPRPKIHNKQLSQRHMLSVSFIGFITHHRFSVKFFFSLAFAFFYSPDNKLLQSRVPSSLRYVLIHHRHSW
jgi:hypothetical protein